MKLYKRVKILGGMIEFVGRTGTVIDIEKDGHQTLYRVKLDEPVAIRGVGEVTDDLWERRLLKILRQKTETAQL